LFNSIVIASIMSVFVILVVL